MAIVEKGISTVRSCWIGTSWKMNKTLAEALDFTKTLAAFLPSLDARIQPFLIPPFTCVQEVKKSLDRYIGPGWRTKYALGRFGRMDGGNFSSDDHGLWPGSR